MKMIENLFDHDGWEFEDLTFLPHFTFINITTIVELPGIKLGSKFEKADLHLESNELFLYTENSYIKYDLNIEINIVEENKNA